jgi:hypothetical protein
MPVTQVESRLPGAIESKRFQYDFIFISFLLLKAMENACGEILWNQQKGNMIECIENSINYSNAEIIGNLWHFYNGMPVEMF